MISSFTDEFILSVTELRTVKTFRNKAMPYTEKKMLSWNLINPVSQADMTNVATARDWVPES